MRALCSRQHLVVGAALLLLVATGCQTVSVKQRDIARVHFELAVKAHSIGDPRAALAEVESSLKTDPSNAEAHNFRGLVLFLPPFRQREEAIAEYRKSIELDPKNADAKVNLGAALMAMERWEEAMAPLDEARHDMIYQDAHLAEGNFGWCKYKLGDVQGALQHLSAAVEMRPSFCLGYRNIAEIHEAAGALEEASRWLERYSKTCPDFPDADYRRGMVLLKRGSLCEARAAFLACRDKAKAGELGDECGKQVGLVPAASCGVVAAPPPDGEEPSPEPQ